MDVNMQGIQVFIYNIHSYYMLWLLGCLLVFLSRYLWEGELSNSHHISIFSRSTHAPNALESFQLRDRTNQFDSIDSVVCYWWQLIDKQDQKKSNQYGGHVNVGIIFLFLGNSQRPYIRLNVVLVSCKGIVFCIVFWKLSDWLILDNDEMATLHTLPSTGNLIDYSTMHYFWIFNNPNFTESPWVCLGIPTQKKVLYIEEKISTCAEAIDVLNNSSCTRSVLNIWGNVVRSLPSLL